MIFERIMIYGTSAEVASRRGTWGSDDNPARQDFCLIAALHTIDCDTPDFCTQTHIYDVPNVSQLGCCLSNAWEQSAHFLDLLLYQYNRSPETENNNKDMPRKSLVRILNLGLTSLELHSGSYGPLVWAPTSESP